MGRTLLIDISNSATKLAGTDGEVLSEKRLVATRELDVVIVEKIAAELGADRAVLSSVVPDVSGVVREVFGGRLLEVGHGIELGVEIDYPEPGTIGQDRLANSAALGALYGAPGVVIDFGTAVTFDILSAGGGKNGTYVGGVIAPGLEVMTDYLYQRTAQLPKIDLLEPEEVVGKSTRSAMMVGAVLGYRGLVREILASIREEIGGGVEVATVATGGYASLISAKVPEVGEVNENLTLEGLRIIGNLND